MLWGIGIDGRIVRTFPAVLGFGAGVATIQGVYDYTGGKLSGYERDPHIDEYERKENLRKNRRRPIQETLEQIGEGRGSCGPMKYQTLVSMAPVIAKEGRIG
ncbi:hypothetical protein ACLMJK_000271 [Lecanora helva]